jgi:hypothetical protein
VAAEATDEQAFAVGKHSRVASRYPALAAALGARAGGDGPTIHDAATAAVDHKGSGSPVHADVAARVGAHLGADFSDVRVHGDPLSREATAAIGARAFAYGGDVFLGPGESGGDLGLMAHELTHVAQQGAAGQRIPQRAVQVGDANSPAEHEADQVAAAVTGGAGGRPAALLVDAPPVGPGQMLKSQFLEQLRAQVTAAADAELGPIYSAIGCPYIENYFHRYADQPAASAEALLRRFAPSARGAGSATDMFPAVVARVREGVRAWRDTGEAPADLAAMAPAAGATGPAQAQALRAPDGRETLGSLEAELGPGQPLDGATASRMAGALGIDVSAARIHIGPIAARKAADAGALAFAVGPNVVMGAGAPAAGTLEGDALLVHELAHTAQQTDAAADPVARRRPIGGESRAAEEHADVAAAGALAQLHGDRGRGENSGLAARLGAAFKTDVQLQRCNGGPRNAGRVNQQINDGRYGWTSTYDVTLSGGEANIVIKVKLVPDAGVTPTQVNDVKTRARSAFRAQFDNKFILTDTADNQQYALRTDVQFVDSGEHYQVQLHDGPDGSSNRVNWYTGNYDETLAHELGHQLGLRDEYVDTTVPNRATATSPGVHTDHSIMGNYLTEGRAAAGVQQRHGDAIGGAVGGATGHTFTVARRR